jgi:uncharacterized SAM-binding protein YcdF (DUF218 family)
LKRLRVWLPRGMAAFTLLFLVITFTPVTGWWAGQLARPWGRGEGDVLLVLSGSMLDDAVLGESSYWRAVYAVRAFRQHGFRRIVLSGRAAQGRSAAEVMRDFLVGHGVPAERIVVETESQSTRENVERSVPLLRQAGGRVVLLTSDFHMHRAYRLLRRAGVEADTIPAPDALKRANFPLSRWSVFLDLTMEQAKILASWWRGWL